MPKFEYETINAQGVRGSGSLSASSSRDAALMLRQQNLRVIKLEMIKAVEETTQASTKTLLLSDKLARLMPVRKRDIINFFQHLGMMLRSGLTLTASLNLLADECQKPLLRKALQKLCLNVQRGQPFSEALADEPRYFPILVRSIIATSEETGELAEGAERIAVNLNFWLELRGKVIHAMIYPIIVIILAVGVTMVMVFFFLPKVERFIMAQGRALPPVTKALFDCTHFVQNQWPYLLAGTACVGVIFWVALKLEKIRRILEFTALNIPVLGRVLEASQLARLSGLLAAMLRSGSDLVQALDLGRNLTRIFLYRDLLVAARTRLVEGLPLREALEHPIMPKTFLGVVAAGEQSGSLVLAFTELEKFYGQRLSTLVLMLAGLLEPALLIVVGGIVGIIYFALFSAITSLVK